MATSQVRGGITWVWVALTEETMVNPRSGRIMNPSLAEYHVPVHLDVPQIDVIWTDIPDPDTPMGGRGIAKSASPVLARGGETRPQYIGQFVQAGGSEVPLVGIAPTP